MKCLAEHARHQRRLAHGDGPLGHGLGDGFDIDGLKIFFIKPRARRLSCDAQDRNRIRNCRIKPGNHVGARRSRRADTDADIAGLGAGVTLGHMRCAFDVARQNVVDRAALLQRRVKRVDRRTRHAEGADNSFFLQNPHRCIDRSHLGHWKHPSLWIA